MRNSPVARTPPKNLPMIPGVTCDKEKPKTANGQKQATAPRKPQENPVEVEKGKIHCFSLYLINII